MSVATLPLRIPYPGLRPFDAADQPVFFGRESQVSAILRQLEDHRFVAVVGSSGSGKSSLVRAGLLPALREGFLFGATDWVIPIIKPGNAPYERLATALCQLEGTLRVPASGGAERDKEALSIDEALTLATLQKSELGLMKALDDAGLPQDRHVMLVVDQFEEIFAFRRATGTDRQEVTSRDEAAAFVNMLLRSCVDPEESRIWVVLTMRSDFIGNCEAFLGLPEAVSRSQFLVPRLDRKQMEDAITRPGEVKTGAFQPFRFQQDLVNRIVNDAGDRPDQLPMMQHALMRTWKRAAGRNGKDGELTLTLEDYEQVGGIEEALSKHADEAWDKIKDDPKKAQIARRLFLLLCDVSPDGQITRRRPQIEEVMAVTSASAVDVEKVMREFQEDDRNFLLPPPGHALAPHTYVDVSHEALLRRWHLFSQWLRDEQEAVAELRRLVDRMKGGALLQAKELDRITLWRQDNLTSEEWAKRYVTADQLNEVRAFVARSAEDVQQAQKAEKQREEQGVRLRRNVVLVVLGTLLVASGVSLFFMLRAQKAALKAHIAAQQAHIAAQQAHTAEQQALIAAQQAQHALTDSFFRTIGVSSIQGIPLRDEREALWELAQLDRANAAVRDNLLRRWFGTGEAFTRGEVRGGQGFRAATGLNSEYNRLVLSGAAEIAKRLAAILENPQETGSQRLSNPVYALAKLAPKMEPQVVAEIAKGLAMALENPQETDSYRLSNLGNALAALAPKMEPQVVAEIAKGLAMALENPQETDSYLLSSLGDALAALAAKMETQVAAEIAKGLAVALENPRETNSFRVSSLGNALAALAAKMEPQAAAEIAKGLAVALENPQETDSYRLSSLGYVLTVLAAKMETQAAAEIATRAAQRLAAALENPQETDSYRLSSLGYLLAALAAKMEPQAAAEIARRGAQRLAAALENPQETDSYHLSNLGNALAALAAKMEPQAAAEIATRAAQRLAATLENPQEKGSYLLSSLGDALAALAAEMGPQAVAEIAKGRAMALENPQETSPDRLSSLGRVLAALAPKMEPQAVAEIAKRLAAILENPQEKGSYLLSSLGDALAALAAKMETQAAAEIAKGLAVALENPRETNSDRVSSLGNALAALAAKMEPQAAAEIAGRGAQRLVTALENPQETDSDRLSNLGRASAAFCALLPSAHHTHLLALSNLLLTPVSEKEDEGKEQPYDRKLLIAVCAQLGPQDLAEVLKYPFSTGEAEQIVLKQLEAKTGRQFGGDVWKFAQQADALGIKDIGSPAQRPSARDALNELKNL